MLSRWPHFWIALIAGLLFIPGLGAVHLFDWDEINFAEIAREMLVTRCWDRPTIGFQPFFEKPPLFIWMQAASMRVFGVGELAARFPNAVCGIVTLIVLFETGRRWRGALFGWFWALAHLGSVLPHLYFRSGIIDPWFNLFILLGVVGLIRSQQSGSLATSAAAGASIGLAVLTKGPVGLLIPLLVMGVGCVMIDRKPPRWAPAFAALVGFAVAAGVPVLWELLANGPEFLVAFFWRQVALLTTHDAGHKGFLGYHPIVLLVGCFPGSLFAIREMIRPSDRSDPRRKWMLALFWVVLILFSLVRTKIVHYSSLCYFSVSYLAALQLENLNVNRRTLGRFPAWLGASGAIAALSVIALPFVARGGALGMLARPGSFSWFAMRAEAPWTGLESLAGIWLLAVLGGAWFAARRASPMLGGTVLFAGSTLFVTVGLAFLIRNVEGHTQRAAIEFFEQRAGERCWVTTVGYKSYAHWFYARTREAPPSDAVLFRGAVDRPVYASCKVETAGLMAQVRGFREIGRGNGFVFWKREPGPGFPPRGPRRARRASAPLHNPPTTVNRPVNQSINHDRGNRRRYHRLDL